MHMIYHKIRIINLKRLIGTAVLLFITAGIFLIIPFYDMVSPVQIKDPASVIQLYQDNITYVAFTADMLYYTGYDYTENGKVMGSYYYNIYDDTCIYFLLPNAQCENRALTLSRVPIKARLQNGGKLQTELIQQMSADLGWTAQGLSAVSSRILINAVDYLPLKYIVLLLISLIIFVASLIIGLNTLSQLIYPLLYPACFHLRRYGSVKEQVRQAEAELHDIPLLKAGIFTITEHYLISITKSQLYLLPLDTIIWGYKHSNLHRFRLKRLRLTYTLRIMARKGLLLVADSQPKEDVDAVLDYLSDYNPEILIGYTKKNEHQAKLRK